jgi:NAD(P)-dependent dehydrogenase (short-subunit alcohol dehydrogenase family)
MIKEFADLKNKVAFVTGGSGVIGGSMAESLAHADMKIILTYRTGEETIKKAEDLNKSGYQAMALRVDVLDEESVKSAMHEVLEKWGKIDVLVNAAGGHVPGTVIPPDKSVFDVSLEGIKKVMDLNLFGTVIPTLVIGREMANRGIGSIINISSMASSHSITRVLGYSMAKAGIDIFTKWMAMEVATKYGDGIRVNAIAPGFFISKQNRDVLIDEQGNYTERALKVISKTPMARFGDPKELNGIVHYLASDASKFVTGTVIPVDGGFSSYSGV